MQFTIPGVLERRARQRKQPDVEGRQIKAARVLLGWFQTELCNYAKITPPTLIDLERETGAPKPSSRAAVVEALRQAGVVFINDGTTIGVLLSKK